MCAFDHGWSDFSRRDLLTLLLGAAALAACRQEPPRPATRPVVSTRPRVPAPDLGCEVFPDAKGRALIAPSAAPVIVIPRATWTTAQPDLTNLSVMHGVQRITVHHSGFKQTFETDAWHKTVESIQGVREFHTGTRKWADIAYHFAVDHLGRVWQCRPLVYQGSHVEKHNAHNLGIVLLGNFDVQQPTAAQAATLVTFLAFLRDLYSVPRGQIFTHGELGKTGCPGKHLQTLMTRIRAAHAL